MPKGNGSPKKKSKTRRVKLIVIERHNKQGEAVTPRKGKPRWPIDWATGQKRRPD